MVVTTIRQLSPSFAKPTRKLHKADWAAFSHQAALELYIDSICSADDLIHEFTNNLICIANNTIPKSKPSTKNTIPSGVMTTVKPPLKPETKLLRVQKHLTQQNNRKLQSFGLARRVIKTSKCHS